MPKYETGDLPTTYETGDLPDPAVGAIPVNPGAGSDAARRDLTGRSPAADAREFGLSALPALGAAGAVALTAASGPAAPVTAPILAALVGGFVGKGVEMGARTATGIGAEGVPASQSERLLVAAHSGLEQAMFETGAGIAMAAAKRVATASVRRAGQSVLGQKLIQAERVKSDFDLALMKNDGKVADLEKRIEDWQATLERNVGSRRAEAQKQIESLSAQKRMLQAEAEEQAYRIGHIEAAEKSVDAALASAGAGTPGAGITKAAYEQRVGGIAKQFEKSIIEEIGGHYVGLEQEAMEKAAAAVDVRPLFERTVARIRAIPKMPGTGGQFTEVNKILSQLELDFSKFSKGKPAVTKAPKPDAAAGVPLAGSGEQIVKEAVAAVDENASLAGLLVMQGGLSQAAAKVAMEGKAGERTGRILRDLLKETDGFIKAEMVKQGWKEGPERLDAVRKAWHEGSLMMEHQAFQLLKKAPERAHELLTASSGYAPVLKKVLKDTGAHDALWPEIRRRWIEEQFLRGGKLDAAGFTQAVRENQPIMGQIFDTPAAQAQLRRLHLGASRLDALTNGTTRNAAAYAKQEAFKGQILKIGEEIASIEAKAQAQVEEIMQAGRMRNEMYRDRLAAARGIEKEALKETYERKLADLGIATNRMATEVFGPVPRMLISRGSAGAIMGLAAGQSIEGALGGLAVGYALQRGEVAVTRQLIKIAENPEAHALMMRVLNMWEREGSARSAQALRLAILGYKGGEVARDAMLVPSH